MCVRTHIYAVKGVVNVDGNDMFPPLPFTYLTHSEFCRIFTALKRFISLRRKKVHKKIGKYKSVRYRNRWDMKSIYGVSLKRILSLQIKKFIEINSGLIPQSDAV